MRNKIFHLHGCRVLPIIEKMVSKHRRIVVIISSFCLVLLVAYFAVIPFAVAHQHTGNLYNAVLQARTDVKTISTGQDIIMFQDPDISPTKRQALLAKTLRDISTAERSLDHIQAINTLPVLPGAGFMRIYHQATIRQARADNAMRQSRQVLHNYAKMLNYVDAYTTPQLHLANQLQYANSITDFTALAGQGSGMLAVADQLRVDHDRLNALTPPPGFAQLQADTLAQLTQASAAFAALGNGLNQRSDDMTYGAVSALEQITTAEDTPGVDSLTRNAQASPTLWQLTELPEKIEHVEGI